MYSTRHEHRTILEGNVQVFEHRRHAPVVPWTDIRRCRRESPEEAECGHRDAADTSPHEHDLNACPFAEEPHSALPAASPPWKVKMKIANTRARTQSGAMLWTNAENNEMNVIHAAPPTTINTASMRERA